MKLEMKEALFKTWTALRDNEKAAFGYTDDDFLNGLDFVGDDEATVLEMIIGEHSGALGMKDAVAVHAILALSWLRRYATLARGFLAEGKVEEAAAALARMGSIPESSAN